WPVRGPEDPRRLALRIVKLHARFPWIKWFQITNEPDIEWATEEASWQQIGDWAEAVWWGVERYRLQVPSSADVHLLFTQRGLVDLSVRSRAVAVAPFVLTSPGGSVDQFDFVDWQGNLRPQLFVWGASGP